MQTVTTKRLKEILRAFKGKEMIVVGDIMLDHFIKGNVSRISPEAPVPAVAVMPVSCSTSLMIMRAKSWAEMPRVFR